MWRDEAVATQAVLLQSLKQQMRLLAAQPTGVSQLREATPERLHARLSSATLRCCACTQLCSTCVERWSSFAPAPPKAQLRLQEQRQRSRWESKSSIVWLTSWKSQTLNVCAPLTFSGRARPVR